MASSLQHTQDPGKPLSPGDSCCCCSCCCRRCRFPPEAEVYARLTSATLPLDCTPARPLAAIPGGVGAPRIYAGTGTIWESWHLDTKTPSKTEHRCASTRCYRRRCCCRVPVSGVPAQTRLSPYLPAIVRGWWWVGCCASHPPFFFSLGGGMAWLSVFAGMLLRRAEN